MNQVTVLLSLLVQVTNDKGEITPIDLQVSQHVIYKKYSGTEVKDAGKEYLIIKAEDILAVVE